MNLPTIPPDDTFIRAMLGLPPTPEDILIASVQAPTRELPKLTIYETTAGCDAPEWLRAAAAKVE